MVAETFHRTILSYDVQRSTSLDNSAKIHIRRFLRDGLDHALTAAGIPAEAATFLDTGDGAIILMDATVSKQQVLDAWLGDFHDVLQRGYERSPERFQTRLSIHAGEVHSSPDGHVGGDLEHACRLVDAPILKQTLAATPSASLGVIVSDVVYQQVVRHAAPALDPASFSPVVVHVKETTAPAWLHLPGWARVPSVSGAHDGGGDDGKRGPGAAAAASSAATSAAPGSAAGQHPGIAVTGPVGVIGTATVNGPFTVGGPAGGAR